MCPMRNNTVLAPGFAGMSATVRPDNATRMRAPGGCHLRELPKAHFDLDVRIGMMMRIGVDTWIRCVE